VKDLKIRLKKEWDRGRLLSAPLTGETLFPLRFPLKRPSSQELFDQYDGVKNWIGDLVRYSKSAKGKGYDLEWLEVNHRQLGKNRIPIAAVFEEERTHSGSSASSRKRTPFVRFSQLFLTRFPVRGPGLRRPL
jgi:hypothetical protein